MIKPPTRRKVLAGTTAVVSTCLPRWALAAPLIGAPAPEFSLPDQDGVVRGLAEQRGKVVVLEWTNHDCPYVRKHYGSGNMQALQQEATRQGVVWFSVASSPEGEQGHVTGRQAKTLTVNRDAAPTAVLLDHRSQAARAYGATTTPQMFVIGPDGVLLYMGGIDSIRSTRQEDIERAQPFFRDALRAVLAGRPVERASTPPYGCAVKYAPI
ncbi:redoxin domain-containing protein [Roseomonas gilardii]|uniref:redoxin domain-containing protein n=1 Tax=Roseomonas gilardii TaxID=257708 RepID=UPI000486F9E5|nr:redoxin domain-containing protein [Roseomonas gilardii]SUE43603.1 AhpC/TSA family [Roseomonas gilardii subsp. rosea]